MRFLIAMPRFAPMGFAYDFPLGLGYVSAALKRAGHEVHCLNLNHEPGEFEDVLERKVREIDPDVFATGGLSPHFPIIAPLFSAARRAKPGIVNLVGGGIFSSDPDAVAPLLDIDIGAVGEADETVVELASALEAGQGLDKVAGLALRQSDGGLRRTPERKALHDIDALPWPDYEGFGVDRLLSMQTAADNSLFHFVDEPRALPMVASRSCPYACTFCFHPIGRIYRERSLDSFFAELKDAVDRLGVNLLLVNDELFAVKKRRLMEFCERIGEFGIRWTAQMHVSILDAEAIAALKKAGCVHASYGLESMSDTVLASMKKKIDRTRLETALRLTHEAEIGIQGNFIFGDSAETLATADETMAWWARHREYHISLSLLQVYPGSPVYHRALAEGRGPAREDLIKETPAVNLTSMTDEEYRRFRFRTAIFRMTLTEPHPPLAFDVDDRPLPHRAETYHLAWECPRCGRRNDLRRV
ncbi:MAG: B12-binding domain-containing radical SAM protein, partial [Magnetospirillum sp. WYHS-4]